MRLGEDYSGASRCALWGFPNAVLRKEHALPSNYFGAEGGEAAAGIDRSPLAANLTLGVRIVNEYGPTETVVGCTIFDAPEDLALGHSTPIGRPIANTQIYILETNLQLSPIGVSGEILHRRRRRRPRLSEQA